MRRIPAPKNPSPSQMLLLPVKSVLLVSTVGFSLYSFVAFLVTATPLEIQFLCAILNVFTAGIGMCTVFHFLPEILHRLDKLEAMENASASDVSIYTIHDRHVESGNMITTTFGATTEELREMVESFPPPEESEETAEFADLLAEKKEN